MARIIHPLPNGTFKFKYLVIKGSGKELYAMADKIKELYPNIKIYFTEDIMGTIGYEVIDESDR